MTSLPRLSINELRLVKWYLKRWWWWWNEHCNGLLLVTLMCMW